MAIKTPEIDIRKVGFYRNLIVNGNYDYWQRGTSYSPTIRRYSADRWITFTGNAAYSSSVTRQASGLTDSPFCIRAQRPNGQTNTNGVFICQVTESLPTQVNQIRGKKVYLRFLARKGANYSATSNQLAVYLGSGTGTNEPGPGSNTFTGQTDVIPTAAVVLTNDWQEFQFEGTIPANCNQLRLEFGQMGFSLNGTAGAADYYELAQVSLTTSKVSSFVYAGQDVVEELALCQRYYEKSYDLDVAPGTSTNFGRKSVMTVGQAFARDTVLYKVTKRARPTVNVWSETGLINTWTRDAGTTAAVGSIINGFSGFTVQGGAFATNAEYSYHWDADAEI